MTSTPNGEYLLNETWHRQPGKGTGKYEGSPTLSKISQTLAHKCLKQTGLFTHPYYSVPSQSIAYHLCGINVAPHSNCKWNDIGFVCSSGSKPCKILSWKCYWK